MAKYQAYPDYKDSGVEWMEEIPAHWVMAKTSRFFKIGMGQTILKEDLVDDGEWPVFSATEGDHYLGRINNPNIKLDEGDIVIPARGNSIGSVKIVTEKSTTSQTTIYCKPYSKSTIFQRYAYFYLNGQRHNLFRFTQTAIPQITTEEVGGNPLILPTYSEQIAIANFLDHETAKIDTLIEKQQQLIQLLKEKRQAVISHAVTKGLNPNAPMKDSGVEWLGQVPEEWEVYKLKHACSEIFLGLTSKVDYVETNGVPLVRALNISGGVLDLTNAREISVEQHKSLTKNRGATRDDVLLSKSGTIGTAAIVDTDVEFSIYESIFALRAIKKILIPEYLLFFIQSSVAKAQYARDSVGMGVNHLNMPDIQDVQIPIPPIRDQELLLDKLYKDLTKFDQLVKKAEDSISFMYERRTALISAAVTGKIDVRNWQAPTN